MKRFIATPFGAEDVEDVVEELTPQEQAKALEEQAEREFLYTENEWKKQLSALDVTMPRAIEDVMGVLTPEQFAALPKATRDTYSAKAQLRAQRPQKP